MHIFGHTHLTVDLVVEGQRYVQWALGTQREQQAMTRAVGDTGMLVLHHGSRDMGLGFVKVRLRFGATPGACSGDVLGPLLPCRQEGPQPDVPRALRSEVLLTDVQRLGASRLNLGQV